MTDSTPVTAAPETTEGSTTAGSPPGPVSGERAPEAPPVDRLSRRGRWVRGLVTVVTFGVLFAGTVWGQDDDFPFGPFRMYAHSAKQDGIVRSARVEGVNVEGERFKLTDASTGLRRAEIEGQIPRFRQRPARLEAVAEAYHARHPDAPELVLVEILQRQYHLEDGDPTGEVTEVQVAAWAEDGFESLADYEDRVEGGEAEIVAEAVADAEPASEARAEPEGGEAG
jgi:hypothetical protein